MQARAEPADTDMILGTLIFTKHEAEYSIKTFRVGSQSWSCAPGCHAPPLFLLPWFPVCVCVLACVCARACRRGLRFPLWCFQPYQLSAYARQLLPPRSPVSHVRMLRVLAKLALRIKPWCACVLLTSCAQDPLRFLVGSHLPTSRRFLSVIHFTSEPRTLYTYSPNNLWTNSQ